MSAVLLRISLIACVLCMCNPMAVFGAVVPVDINAVDLQAAFVSRSHVGYETDGVMPLAADGYAASPIAVPASRLLAVTAMHYRDPLTVDGVHVQPMLGSSLFLQAAAALYPTTLYLVDSNEVRRSAATAIANRDISIGPGFSGDAPYRQSSEFLSDRDRFGGVRLKSHGFEVKHCNSPVTNDGSIVASGVIN